MIYKGIDVSYYQGANINWEAVRDAGIDFAYIRAVSSKSAAYIDPTFEANYVSCRRAGLSVGCYLYSYATNQVQADKELTLLKSCLQGKQFDYPIVLDVEDQCQRSLGKESLTWVVSYMLKTIESWGCFAQLYTYTDFANTALDMQQLKDFNLWIADYRGQRPSRAHGVWQFSAKNAFGVPGFGTALDCNYSYIDFPSVIKAKGLNGYGQLRKNFRINSVDASQEAQLRALCQRLNLSIMEDE